MPIFFPSKNYVCMYMCLVRKEIGFFSYSIRFLFGIFLAPAKVAVTVALDMFINFGFIVQALINAWGKIYRETEMEGRFYDHVRAESRKADILWASQWRRKTFLLGRSPITPRHCNPAGIRQELCAVNEDKDFDWTGKFPTLSILSLKYSCSILL